MNYQIWYFMDLPSHSKMATSLCTSQYLPFPLASPTTCLVKSKPRSNMPAPFFAFDFLCLLELISKRNKTLTFERPWLSHVTQLAMFQTLIVSRCRYLDYKIFLMGEPSWGLHLMIWTLVCECKYMSYKMECMIVCLQDDKGWNMEIFLTGEQSWGLHLRIWTWVCECK